MGSARKRRNWKIETLYGTQDLRPYIGCLAIFILVGIVITVADLLDTEQDPKSLGLITGMMFVFLGSFPMYIACSQYRKINRPETKDSENT